MYSLLLKLVTIKNQMNIVSVLLTLKVSHDKESDEHSQSTRDSKLVTIKYQKKTLEVIVTIKNQKKTFEVSHDKELDEHRQCPLDS